MISDLLKVGLELNRTYHPVMVCANLRYACMQLGSAALEVRPRPGNEWRQAISHDLK